MCPLKPSVSFLTRPRQTQPLWRQINFNSLDHNKLIFIRKVVGEDWSPELQRFKPAVDRLLAFGLRSKYRRRGFLKNAASPSSIGGAWGRLGGKGEKMMLWGSVEPNKGECFPFSLMGNLHATSWCGDPKQVPMLAKPSFAKDFLRMFIWIGWALCCSRGWVEGPESSQLLLA